MSGCFQGFCVEMTIEEIKGYGNYYF